MFTETAQQLNDIANFFENQSTLSPINLELEVEMCTTDLMQELNSFEKKVAILEDQLFFSAFEIRGSFLERIREFYLIINELDYNILRIEGLTIQERLDTIESIQEQLSSYLRKLEQLEKTFELEIKKFNTFN